MSRTHSVSFSLSGDDYYRALSENVDSSDISTVKRMKTTSDNASVDQKKKRLYNTDVGVNMDMKTSTDMFETWSGSEQVEFLCRLLPKMDHFQQSQVNDFLEPLLKRDFIVAFRNSGVIHLAEGILSHLDAESLLSVELVSKGWQHSVASYQLWRRLLLRRVTIDPVWHGLAERRGWLDLIRRSNFSQLPTLLEQRRLAMSLRHSLSEMPLLTALHTYNPAGCSKAYDPQNGFSQLLLASKLNIQADYNDSQSVGLMLFAHRFYKQLYPRIIKDLKRVEENWRRGYYYLTRIPCRSDVTKGVYCLQYDNEKIVSGLRDDTIKVWRRLDRPAGQSQLKSIVPGSSRLAIVPHCSSALAEAASANRSSVVLDSDNVVARTSSREVRPVPPAEVAAIAGDRHRAENVSLVSDAAAGTDGYKCTQVMEGHSGSVLCLQYIGHLLISGSSDTSVRLWDLASGRCLNVISHHSEAVLHLRFQNSILVTCSKDRSIAVWDMGPHPKDVQLRQVLVGHRAAVNVVDFDDKYIVSASGDRTIKVWATDTCSYVRTLTGHRRGIACLQYRDRLIVSGSSDNTIRIWDIETGVCFRVLEGHEELVRCIRFDSKRIVSGAYDGKIKIWDLKAALNPRSKPNQLCVHTLQQHTGRVFRLQFDDFQIVSSSHDDSILIWDFARPCVDNEDLDDGYDDGIQAVLVPQPMNCVCPSLPTTTPPAASVVPTDNANAFGANPFHTGASESGPVCPAGEACRQSGSSSSLLSNQMGGSNSTSACQCVFYQPPARDTPEATEPAYGSEPPPQHLEYP